MLINLAPGFHSADTMDTTARCGVWPGVQSVLCIHFSVRGRWAGCSISTWDMRVHEVIMKISSRIESFPYMKNLLKMYSMNAPHYSKNADTMFMEAEMKWNKLRKPAYPKWAKDRMGDHGDQLQAGSQMRMKVPFLLNSKERVGPRLWSSQVVKMCFLQFTGVPYLAQKQNPQKKSFRDSHSSYDK